MMQLGKPIVLTVTCVTILAVLYSPGYGQSTSRGLLESTQLGNNEIVRAVILLQQQYDHDELRESVENLPRDERSAIVWHELLHFSQITQTPLINILQAELERGRVRRYVPIRICNGIMVEAYPDVFYELQRRDDIAAILDDRMIATGEAESEFVEDPIFAPVDELDDISWNIARIGAPEVWADGFTGEGILVAIIDTGVNYEHVDLQDHLWDGGDDYPNHGYDFHNDDNDPMDVAGHGTRVAGIVAGDGTAGDTTGVAPDAILMCLKVRENLNLGEVGNTWLAQDFALEHGADITSMSLGWGDPDPDDLPIWRNIYDILDIAGIVNIKSAGNNRGTRVPPESISVPGAVPSPWRNPDETGVGAQGGLITVGATRRNDQVLSVSSPGPVTWMDVTPFNDWPYNPLENQFGLIKPDLAAPGESGRSLSYTINTAYSSFSNTSMAQPHVAGVAALLLSVENNLTTSEVDSILQSTAIDFGDQGKDNDFGAGLVYAPGAIDALDLHLGTLTGTVLDESTGLPVEGAIVYGVQRTRRQDITDTEGDYTFDIPEGTYDIGVSFPAFPFQPLAVLYDYSIEEDQVYEVPFTIQRGNIEYLPESYEIVFQDSMQIVNENMYLYNGGLAVMHVRWGIIEGEQGIPEGSVSFNTTEVVLSIDDYLPVHVTFTANDIDPGDYFGSIEILHNASPDTILVPFVFRYLSSVDDEQMEHPVDPLIVDVFPNPFNAAAQVQIRVIQPTYLTAILYDITGREVDHVFSDFVRDGAVSFMLESNRIASGLYILKIQSQYGMHIQKVLFLN